MIIFDNWTIANQEIDDQSSKSNSITHSIYAINPQVTRARHKEKEVIRKWENGRREVWHDVTDYR